MSGFGQNEAPPVDLNILIRHVVDLEEVIVTVPESANMRELKEILAVQVERPELVEKGEMFRCLPDGTHTDAPLKESMKVKSFRLIGFKGCPLHPPPPERPPPTLEDFNEHDPDEVITSPRSIRACILEGVPVGDLLHVPLHTYTDQCVERRISVLWFEFFEALRQDYLAAARETRKSLAVGDDERIISLAEGSVDSGSRIGGFGGNWIGCLEHSKYPMVLRFFREQSEMCSIDKIYKGIAKPSTSIGPASVKLSRTVNYWDQDPVSISNTADEAADKLDDVLAGYESIRGTHRYVQEQRLALKANGVVQYAMNVKTLHSDQKEKRRLVERRIETQEVQIANVDGDVQYRNYLRRGLDARALGSKPQKATNKEEERRLLAIRKRAEDFATRRELVHEKQMDDEYARCDKMDELTLRDQAVEYRVHQHRSKKALSFARQWVLRRTRWQLNRNTTAKDQHERSNSILEKHRAAAERVDTQRLITQKCTEYKREINALRRLFADVAGNREKMRADARREAVSAEFLRLASEEAVPSQMPNRWNDSLSMASMSSLGNVQMSDATLLPNSNLLKQSRVTKREARFDFPQMAKGFFAPSPTASTAASTTARSISSPSLQNSVSAVYGDANRIQSSVSAPSLLGGSNPRREVRYDV